MTDLPETPCPEWLPLLHGLADNELDAEHALRVEAHLGEHPACEAEMVRIQATRRTLREANLAFKAPDHLRARIAGSLAAEMRVAIARRDLPLIDRLRAWIGPIVANVRHWSLPTSFAVLALAALVVIIPRPALNDGLQSLEADLVAGHVRSLLADHLMDVATSDRHTVKPWFNGRIDFSPPVADLKADGFPLKGGRIDYIDGRVVAALAFQRDKHVINLFIWPKKDPLASEAARDGFNLLGWTDKGLTFWAVSDLNAADLKTFAEDFRVANPD